MSGNAVSVLASLITLWTGIFWGAYWLPVRALADLGLAGAWGTLAITLAAAGILSPVALARRRELAAADPLALASVALGGAAFALYSVGFLYGRMAIIILLWFQSPVWSTLIGRYVMGWPTPLLRLVAIVVGLTGLAVMLGGDGKAPLPRGAGEWMSSSAASSGRSRRPGSGRSQISLPSRWPSYSPSVPPSRRSRSRPCSGPCRALAAGDTAKAVGLVLATGGQWDSMAGLM